MDIQIYRKQERCEERKIQDRVHGVYGIRRWQLQRMLLAGTEPGVSVPTVSGLQQPLNTPRTIHGIIRCMLHAQAFTYYSRKCFLNKILT
jgi:hypothetical protein